MVPLRVNCPICSHTLMDSSRKLDGFDSVLLHINLSGKVVDLRLSSIFGSFRFESGQPLVDGDITEPHCPSCGQSLLAPQPCQVCSAPMARLGLEADGHVLFCARKGCKNHKVELYDLEKSLDVLYASYNSLKTR